MVTTPEEVMDIIAIIMLGDMKREITYFLINMIVFAIDVVSSMHEEKEKRS